jgi:hypothetical protein
MTASGTPKCHRHDKPPRRKPFIAMSAAVSPALRHRGAPHALALIDNTK